MKALAPGVDRTPFTAEEDRIIVARRKEDMAFADIATVLPKNRTADQVRDRYNNAIEPGLKKKVPWSREEKDVLHRAQMTLGNKWAAIAKLLPGRSENDVKNQWHNSKNPSRKQMKDLAKQMQALERESASANAAAPAGGEHSAVGTAAQDVATGVEDLSTVAQDDCDGDIDADEAKMASV